jgi:hypothetical protein
MMRALLILLAFVGSALGANVTNLQTGQSLYNGLQLTSVASGEAACSTSQTTNAWDNFLEGFQNPTTGCDSNWTQVGTSANIFTNADSSSLTKYKPDGACNQAVKFVVPTDGTETYLQMDLGAAIDVDSVQTDVYFSIYVETAPDNFEYIPILGMEYNANPYTRFGVQLAKVGGQLVLLPVDSAGADNISIATGQWYVCKLSYDTAKATDGSTFTVWSNGSQVGQSIFTRGGGGAADIRYIFLGPCYALDVNDSGTFWIDLFMIKTN